MDATPTPTDTTPTAAPPLVRATLLASATLTIMAAAVIAPSLPGMLQVFADVPRADVLVRLALTVTALTIGITAPLAGLVADRVGRTPLLVFSLVLYSGAGVAGFFTTDLVALLVSRALLGVAVGGIMTAVSVLITDYFHGPDRARVLGLQSAFASLGGVVFLPLAGVLAGISWSAPFWIYAAAAPVVLLAILALREPVRAPSSSRRTGAPTTGPAPASGASRAIAVVYLLAFAGTLVFFMAPTQLPFSLQRFAVAPTTIGLVVAGSTLTSMLAALGYSRVRQFLGSGPVTALSLGLLGAGWVLVGTAATLAQVVAGVLVGGVGVGLVVPNLTLALSELASPARRGRVLGGLVTAIFLGQFASPLVVQPLIAALGIDAAFTWTGLASLAGAAALALAARPAPARRA